MIEVFSPPVERIEKRGINLELLKRETSSKTFRGYLEGLKRKAKLDNNTELEYLFSEVMNKFNEFYPQKIIRTEIEIVSGWKGKGDLEIYKGITNNFMCREAIKDKETGEVKFRQIEVLKEDLNKMIFILKSLKVGEEISCYDVSSKLGYSSWKELWKERRKYFKGYYYPIKVLEALNLIKYGGKGNIVKLK